MDSELINQLIKNQKDCADNPFSKHYPEIIQRVFSDPALLSTVDIYPMSKCVECYNKREVIARVRKLSSIHMMQDNIDIAKLVDLFKSNLILLLARYKSMVNKLVFMPYCLIIPMQMPNSSYNFATRFGLYYDK